MRAVALVALLAGLLVIPASAPAAGPAQRASLSQIEAEVMCPVCGTLLELADSPQARREKAFIRRLISRGLTREQIRDALVAQYGHDVLALPEGSGFDLSAYLVPAVAFVLATIGLGLAVLRWRRGSESEDTDETVAAPADEDSERLDEDMRRYDL